ncbi:MAG: ABC transporter substrate-binding protein [Desulfobacteraceae bacterium]|nr:ABC transporter substrate-binding protein [Desulfobacteraceae bacterium]
MKKNILLVLISLLLIGSGQVIAKSLRVVNFGADIPGITSLDQSFDPDSYSVITQIFDSLIHIDLEGKLIPGLATSWELVDDQAYEFELRENVKFHNGEPFTGECVKYTYEAVVNPETKAGNAWILNSIKNVEVLSKYRIRINLNHPDGMFLYRLSMFGSIVPVKYIQEKGLANFLKSPVGTGPFKFVNWEKGKEIVLKKNPDYWQNGIPVYEELIFKIIPEENWVSALKNDQVDVITNLHPELMREINDDGRFKTVQKLVLQGYWVMLKNQGPLADINVRKALNHAVDKNKLIKVQNGNLGIPMVSLGMMDEIGSNRSLKPYGYSPVISEVLLEKAGQKDGFKLKAITVKQAEKLSISIKEDLKKIGVDLELEVVSRPEWAKRVIGGKMANQMYDGDMAINLVDNPIVNLAFHAGLFLASGSPWSLMNDPVFDEKFQQALFQAEHKSHLVALGQLDEYIHDQAMMLFTFQPQRVFAMKKDVMLPGIGLNGHVDYYVFSHAR